MTLLDKNDQVNENYKHYFENRVVDAVDYAEYHLPRFIIETLPKDKNAPILDIGCGFGQMLKALRGLGYTNLCGVDLSQNAVEYCVSEGLSVTQISSLEKFANENTSRYSFIIMSHVLEHLPKDQAIPTLKLIKNQLLEEGGQLCVLVPNAQSHTGAYWMYEDFTHYTLFTAGSLYYVLKCAGFGEITFLDPTGASDSSPIIRLVKHFLLYLYSKNQDFWNSVTGSSFHKKSPRIYTFELRAIAK